MHFRAHFTTRIVTFEIDLPSVDPIILRILIWRYSIFAYFFFLGSSSLKIPPKTKSSRMWQSLWLQTLQCSNILKSPNWWFIWLLIIWLTISPHQTFSLNCWGFSGINSEYIFLRLVVYILVIEANIIWKISLITPIHALKNIIIFLINIYYTIDSKKKAFSVSPGNNVPTGRY